MIEAKTDRLELKLCQIEGKQIVSLVRVQKRFFKNHGRKTLD
jgi:hypothetical protein